MPASEQQALSWDLVRQKFDELSASRTTPDVRDRMAAAVRGLERIAVSDLTTLLAPVTSDRAESHPVP
jgi:hypothetical protein